MNVQGKDWERRVKGVLNVRKPASYAGFVASASAPQFGPSPRANVRLLLRAGVPAAAVLIALVVVLLWRVAVLQAASANEDRADQSVVAAAELDADFVRLQNDQRAVLLTEDLRLSRRSILVHRVDDRFAQLYSLLKPAGYDGRVATLHALYIQWRAASEPALLLRHHSAGRAWKAVTLQLALSAMLRNRADALLQDLRGRRMDASHMNEDAARSAVLASIVGMVALLAVLAVSVLWSLGESQREMQRQWDLERQNEQMRDLARIKSEFVTHMSHELRTPLTGIMGIAELLRDEKAGALTARQRRYLNDVLASSAHLLELINGVLNVAKAEAGKIVIQPRECNPVSLALGVLKTMRSVAASRRITLSLDARDSPETVVTDPARFRQILYNYLSNALKFTPAGGRVTVRISPEPPNRFRVEVSDTGIGIAKDDLGKLFADFSQLDGPIATQRGAGLGLALSKRLAQMQGGSVGVTSAKGRGSTFYAVLPAAAAAEGATNL